MTKFITYYKVDLNPVFKVTRIIESFDFGTSYVGANGYLWVWNIFIMSVDTSIKDLSNIHQPDQFDFCHGHSSNTDFQWISVDFLLNSYIVLRPLG